MLIDQVDAGAIELLDLEILGNDGGVVSRLPISALQADEGFDLAVLDGAESDILDADDLAAIGDALAPGHLAIAVVYEDRSLAGVATAWGVAGGTQLWSGGVDVEALEQSLAVADVKED